MQSKALSVACFVVVVASLLACKKSGPKEVKASCDMRSAGSESAICIDFHVEPNSKVREICSESNGYTLTTTPCDTSTALGGCQKGNLTNWYYSSTKYSSADDVKRECTSGDFVMPAGR
jgi:hypothetical protein